MTDTEPSLKRWSKALHLELIQVFAEVEPSGVLLPYNSREWDEALRFAAVQVREKAMRFAIASAKQEGIPHDKTLPGAGPWTIVTAETLQDGIRELRRRGEMNMSKMDQQMEGGLWFIIDNIKREKSNDPREGDWTEIQTKWWIKRIRESLHDLPLVRAHLAELEIIESMRQLSPEDIAIFQSHGIRLPKQEC